MLRGSPRRGKRRLSLIVAVCCFGGGGPMGADAFADPSGNALNYDSLNACEQAGIAAEQANGLPAGLLLAIGRVESGRWDPERGRTTAWPWAINAAGKGQWFEAKDAAVQTVGTLRESGVRSIDVGCFQINLLWHPLAFTSVEQGFDPAANARYAAKFLLSLFGRTGSWEAAVEAYHSADPALGYAYRQQVFSTWSAASTLTAVASAPVSVVATTMLASVPKAPPVAMPLVIAGVQIWTPMPVGTAAGVVAMPPADPSLVPVRAAATPQYQMGPLPVVSYRVMPRR